MLLIEPDQRKLSRVGTIRKQAGDPRNGALLIDCKRSIPETVWIENCVLAAGHQDAGRNGDLATATREAMACAMFSDHIPAEMVEAFRSRPPHRGCRATPLRALVARDPPTKCIVCIARVDLQPKTREDSF